MTTSTTDQPSDAEAAPTKTFRDFKLDPKICDSLEAAGIINPFPIQEMTLPLALTGADIIGQARTGTGKTLGFGLPMLQRTDLDGGLQSLIIVPTRELCLQVAEDLAQAGEARGVKVVAVYGGKSMQPQIDALEAGVHMVVGTPGRLLDLSRRGHLKLGECVGLVLDEADEMLDLGFLPDVEQLIEQCADKRQTLLFSATMPAAIVGLARRYMVKPTFMRADVEEITIAPKTRQFFFSCHRMDKPAVLARILSTPDRGLCVVFCRTKRMADQLAEELRERDITAQAIHSDLRQEARERALQKFREGKISVLCATEVAARGLDIDDVTHVVNYDCPDDEKMYLHRIGRTGRAGADGVAITFAVWNELPRLDMIRRELDIQEEVHEVFSTSPMLDELFDLTPREETKKVPSPPQARRGAGSRSKRRADKRDEDTEETPARGRSSRGGSSRGGSSDTDGRAKGGRRSSGSDDSSSDDDTTTRTSSRRDGGRKSDEARSKDTKGDDTASSNTRSSDTRSSDARSGAEQGDDGEPRRRRRRRRRTTGGADDSSGSSTISSSSSEDADDDDAPRSTRRSGKKSSGSAEDRTTSRAADDDEGDGDSGRTRTRSGRGRGDDDRGSSNRKDSAFKDSDQKDSDRGRNRSTGGSDDDSSDDGSSRGKGSRSRSGGKSGSSNRDGGNRDGGNRDGGGRSRGGRSRSQDSSGQDSRKKSSGSGRTRTRPDPDEARGNGNPRLTRKLEVQHLP